ncbi:katanin p60 fidgetin family with AAA ATpase [Cryptosporidium sp. chipmunk genotype I]|uniref:katanin p60 fidgetin family with AAA ATpase n=1 Tax=Cryptosporidium sp. chipmunk genotype I TaxID=1280935 RepID=UPI00351A16CD|nr:katanin p60 fidgetin family with AAA ATpase [Cryptosporidium sp. chipmunk genotype I]
MEIMEEEEVEVLSEFFKSKSIGTGLKRRKCWEMLVDELVKLKNGNEFEYMSILRMFGAINRLERDSDIIFRDTNSPFLNDKSILKWSEYMENGQPRIKVGKKSNQEIMESSMEIFKVRFGGDHYRNELLDMIYLPNYPDYSDYINLDQVNNSVKNNLTIKPNKREIENMFTTGLSELGKSNPEMYEKQINKENSDFSNSKGVNLLSYVGKNVKGLTSNHSQNIEAERILASLGGKVKIEHIEWVLSIRTEPKNFISEKDVIGLESIKKMLRVKIINPIQRPDLHVGLHSAPRGILLFGPPGTGKTMLAKWIASECKASFYDVSPGSIMSKFYGETENIIKALFMISEYSSPSIIFIDEIDSIFSKRTSKDDDNSIRLKNQFLQMIDGVQSDLSKIVVVIGATNRPDMLDDAALRRLSKRVLVPLPDMECRLEQIKYILEKNTQGGCQITYDQLKSIATETHGWNGSDIKNLCIKAAEFSYDETIEKYNGIHNVPNREAFRPITIQDFNLSLKLVKPSYSSENDQNNHIIKWSNLFGVV